MSVAAHWAERYVGRAYVEGAFDCADLIVLVLREQFGREIALPAHPAGMRDRDRLIGALTGEYAVPIIEPREGDAVLMRAAGRRRVTGHHIGLWCRIGAPQGAPYVLHCLKGAGTCLHAMRALKSHGLEVTGVYRWT